MASGTQLPVAQLVLVYEHHAAVHTNTQTLNIKFQRYYSMILVSPLGGLSLYYAALPVADSGTSKVNLRT